MYFFAQERKTQNDTPLNSPRVTSSQPVIIFEEESSVSIGTEGVVNISLPVSDTSKPTAYDLTFYYDPDAVEVIDVEPGSMWSDSNILRKNIDNTNGRVRLAAGQGFNGTLTSSRQVAMITYKPLKSGRITFTLASNSTFAYSGRDLPEQVSGSELIIDVQ